MQHIHGQPRALECLRTGMAAGRLHHAYIFHGPSGVGKFTTAMALARVLLCKSPGVSATGDPQTCGACESCLLLQLKAQGDRKRKGRDVMDDAPLALAHPDLHVVTKELARYSSDRLVRDRKLTQIPVDVLRAALLDPVQRAAQLTAGPMQLARKVFVVDEAELLNDTGQNLLLKTLEEPPRGTVIILVTASEDRLLPTIRSRCQRVGFIPLEDEVVRKWIEHAAAHQGATLADTDWIVEFAEGSLGRADMAMRFGLAEWGRAVLPELDHLAKTGATRSGALGAAMAERIEAFATAWVDAHEGASKEAANKLACGLMWSAIANHARRRIRELSRGGGGDVLAAEEALGPWLSVVDSLEDAQRNVATNVNLSLVCDHLASVLARVLDGTPGLVRRAG